MDALWHGIAVHLWQSTLVLCALFAAWPWLRRAPARMIRLFALAGLLKLLLPWPVLGALTARLLASLGLLDGWRSAGEGGLFGLRVLLAPEILVIRPGGGFDPFFWFTAIWLGGAGLIAGRWIGTTWRSSRSRAHEAVAARLPSRLRDALAGSGVPTDRVRLSQLREVPHVAGLLRPRIVLSETLVERLGADELRSILLHEDAHRRRLDPLLEVLVRVAVLSFWYYPLLWPLLRRLRAAIEMDCDERVLARVPAQVYSRAIERTIHLCLAPAESLALTGRSSSLLARRLRRIAEHGRYVAMTRHRILVVAGCLLVVIGSLAPAPWADSQDPPQGSPSPQLPSGEEPLMVDEGMTRPVLKTKVPPVYPAEAKEQRIEGRVMLQVVIRRDGKMDQVQVLRAEKPGHGFEEAAIRAVKQWIYEPATKDGEPVDVYFTVRVDFSLK